MAIILIAEDERDIRDLIKFTLNFAGHEVIVTKNGEEAFEKAQEITPDLIMMDVRMPRMTGYEACKRMKEIDRLKSIPVVFLSAKGQESEVQAGLDAGAVEYILKPFAPNQLTERVESLLAKYGTQSSPSESPEAQTPAAQPPAAQTPASPTPLARPPAQPKPAAQPPAPQTPTAQPPIPQTPAARPPTPQTPNAQPPAPPTPLARPPAQPKPAAQPPAAQPPPVPQTPAPQIPAARPPTPQTRATRPPESPRPNSQSTDLDSNDSPLPNSPSPPSQKPDAETPNLDNQESPPPNSQNFSDNERNRTG